MIPKELFKDPKYLEEKEEMLVINEIINRFTKEKPFNGAKIVVGHLLAINSLTMIEALHQGGAEITICFVREFVRDKEVGKLLRRYGIIDFPKNEAVKMGDYYLDEAGELGKTDKPSAAVEITRTGELFYQNIECPVISVDRSKVKHFEDFLGTGDSFVRAWETFKPDESLTGKRIIQFGYGKVGRGVAFKAREKMMEILIVDTDPIACAKAKNDGFQVINGANDVDVLKDEMPKTDIIVGVTGIPGAVGRTIKREWINGKNLPTLINMGYDEFGDGFEEDLLLMKKKVPVNLLLNQPTLNKYIDTALAAQVLAMEELILSLGKYSNGIHPLPLEIDNWVIDTWINFWPSEDIDGIKEELNLLA